MTRKRSRRADAAPESREVASFTECTGLMPALPRDEAEDESSAALYDIHSAEDAKEKN